MEIPQSTQPKHWLKLSEKMGIYNGLWLYVSRRMLTTEFEPHKKTASSTWVSAPRNLTNILKNGHIWIQRFLWKPSFLGYPAVRFLGSVYWKSWKTSWVPWLICTIPGVSCVERALELWNCRRGPWFLGCNFWKGMVGENLGWVIVYFL